MTDQPGSEQDEDERRPRGRPTEYKPEYADQARKLCELGATDMELADFFECDTRSIYRWRNVHPDFCQAVMVGKDAADERVKRSLYLRAVGYEFETEKVFQYQGAVIRADTREHVPPETAAAMNWLKNRRPDEWREKVDHEHSGPNGAPIKTESTLKVDGLSNEQLRALASIPVQSG